MFVFTMISLMKKNLNRVLIYAPGTTSGIIEILRACGAQFIVTRNHTQGNEYDFHCTDPARIKSVISRSFTVERFDVLVEQDQMNIRRNDIPLRQAFKISNELIEQERFWEVHTILEPFWRMEGGEMKKYLQGIILIASAMVKHQMGRTDVAEHIYDRALSILSPLSPSRKILDQIPKRFAYPITFLIPE